VNHALILTVSTVPLVEFVTDVTSLTGLMILMMTPSVSLTAKSSSITVLPVPTLNSAPSATKVISSIL